MYPLSTVLKPQRVSGNLNNGTDCVRKNKKFLDHVLSFSYLYTIHIPLTDKVKLISVCNYLEL